MRASVLRNAGPFESSRMSARSSSLMLTSTSSKRVVSVVLSVLPALLTQRILATRCDRAFSARRQRPLHRRRPWEHSRLRPSVLDGV